MSERGRGDRLRLREWVPSGGYVDGFYTGREQFVTVTYLLPGGRFGLEPDVCVLSIDLEAALDGPG